MYLCKLVIFRYLIKLTCRCIKGPLNILISKERLFERSKCCTVLCFLVYTENVICKIFLIFSHTMKNRDVYTNFTCFFFCLYFVIVIKRLWRASMLPSYEFVRGKHFFFCYYFSFSSNINTYLPVISVLKVSQVFFPRFLFKMENRQTHYLCLKLGLC